MQITPVEGRVSEVTFPVKEPRRLT